MLGSDARSGPTEEDRTPHMEGMEFEVNVDSSGEDNCNGWKDHPTGNKKKKVISCISEITFKEALEDILSPPVTSSIINQTIRTGFLERPEIAPAHVLILAEAIPSWLAAADSWGAHQLSLYCEKEVDWCRSHLDIMTPLQVFKTVAGLGRGSWLNEPNKIMLIQGSTRFCSKMVSGLKSLELTTEDKIIVTCNGTPRKLKLSFIFLRLSHASFGGCTETKTSVGFSKGCGVDRNVEISEGIPSSVADHVCPVESGTSVDPLSNRELSSKCITTMRNIVNNEFIVPSLFSKTHWVKRRLTSAEILSTLDSPVQITKAVNDKKLDIKLDQNDEVVQTLIPLKTIQETSRILFGFSIPKEERHVIPLYDVYRLAPEILGLHDIYSEIDQAMVARADDSAIDTSLWDDQAAHYSGTDFPDDFDFKVVISDPKHLKGDKEVLFSALRTISHHRYRKNTRESFNRYMKSTHGYEVSGLGFDDEAH